MKDFKKIILLIATAVLVVAAILCFTVFNNKNEHNGGGKGNEPKIDINKLHNMVPFVQTANYGFYPYNKTSVSEISKDHIIVGALNYYIYINCRTESTKNSCDTIEGNKIISIIKEIYGLDFTAEDLEKSALSSDEAGAEYFVYSRYNDYQMYAYKGSGFNVYGLKGLVNKSNSVEKYEEKDDSMYIYEKVYFLGIKMDDNNNAYEVIYSDDSFSKEVAREKIDDGGIDLSKYDKYGAIYKHTFKKISEDKYQYVSTEFNVEEEEEKPVEELNQ